MSYRTFKKLLGETSLERKCRFLFGAGLLLLITGSFYLYGNLTAALVNEQINSKNINTGRLLKARVLSERHWVYFETNPRYRAYVDKFIEINQTPGDSDYKLWLYSPSPKDAAKGPTTQDERDAIDWLQLNQNRDKEEYVNRRVDGEFRYYGAVRAQQLCIQCHELNPGEPKWQENDLMAVLKVTWPLERTERSLALNNAILIAMAIGTAFLAMTAAYAIVRYVIVKPVLHLKTVSDAISRGQLDQRADIRTGDEFEQLSQAFNRMLRHLVHMQEELQEVNSELDGKVDQLAQANMRLYELNNLKNDFLATMTHELRTPLNSIIGFSDVLASADNLNERQQRYLRNIQTSGKDLLTLVNDILDLAKIESGKMDLHMADLVVADLIERLASMMRPMAEKRNIELTTSIDRRLPSLQQDAGKIQQILYNLLSNAIKFTPEGGRVWVEAHLAADDQLRLVVGDTGVGIPMEDQETIFEKFRQGNIVAGSRHNSLTREYAGTGLGLSIVRELSKLLGGDVSLFSELGKGSVFTVRLPITLKPNPKSISDVLAANIRDELSAVDEMRLIDRKTPLPANR